MKMCMYRIGIYIYISGASCDPVRDIRQLKWRWDASHLQVKAWGKKQLGLDAAVEVLADLQV